MQAWVEEDVKDLDLLIGKENIDVNSKENEQEPLSPTQKKQMQRRRKKEVQKNNLQKRYGSTGIPKRRGLSLKAAGSPKSYRMSKLSNTAATQHNRSMAAKTPEHAINESPHRSSKRGSNAMDDEDFAQWVSNNKKLTSALYTRTSSTRNKSSVVRGGGGAIIPKRSSGHLRNNFVSKKRGMGYRSREKKKPSPLTSPKRTKHEVNDNSGWNSRIQRGIPVYDAKKDRHCKVRKKKRSGSNTTRRPKKRNPYTTSSRYGSKRRATSTYSKASSHGSSTRSKRISPLTKPKQAWTEERQVLQPAEMEAYQKKIQELEFQLQQSQTESMRVIELKEHTIKQLRLEKYKGDKHIEKLKTKNTDLIGKLSTAQTTLEKREKREKRLKREAGRRSKGSKEVTGEVHLKEKVQRQKAEIKELEGELNMFKTQNRMLRANEQQDRNTREDARDELIRLRKRVRIEQERVRKLKEKVSGNDKATTRIEKLTKYLEREKKDTLKYQEKFQKLDVHYQAIRAELADAKAKMTQMTGENSTTTQRMQNVHGKLETQKAKCEQLEADKKLLKDQILKLERSSTSSTKSTNTLMKQLKEKEEDIKRVARRVTELEKEKLDWEAQSSNKNDALKRLQVSHSELKLAFENLQQVSKNNVADERAQFDSKMEVEKRQLKQKLEREFHDKLKEASRVHTGEITRLNAQHQQALAKANAKAVDAESKISQLTAQVKRLQEEQAVLKKKVNDTATTMMLEQKIDSLTKKLKESTDRCSVLSESNALLLMRLKREESKGS
mmetsp:Transcript_3646/g.5385  ORF Transcript_3646/g.5385 Transcript_3646/m.5385 type:complete len:780 (+) Transcript_3646:181-2520(+)